MAWEVCYLGVMIAAIFPLQNHVQEGLEKWFSHEELTIAISPWLCFSDLEALFFFLFKEETGLVDPIAKREICLVWPYFHLSQ